MSQNIDVTPVETFVGRRILTCPHCTTATGAVKRFQSPRTHLVHMIDHHFTPEDIEFLCRIGLAIVLQLPGSEEVDDYESVASSRSASSRSVRNTRAVVVHEPRGSVRGSVREPVRGSVREPVREPVRGSVRRQRMVVDGEPDEFIEDDEEPDIESISSRFRRA